jgi:hypothetical protein
MRLSESIPADAPEYLGTTQLAKYLDTVPATIRAWARRGVLPPGIRKGPRNLIFKTSEVRAALDRQEDQAVSSNGEEGWSLRKRLEELAERTTDPLVRDWLQEMVRKGI